MKSAMKTGSYMTIRQLPETFYILLLGFDGILKRYGIKDCVHFKQHNPIFQMNADLFAASVCFNLFSEFGVGKKLEPLIYELFKTLELDPDLHEENIFFQEIVKLSEIIAPIIRRADPKEEAKWSYDYAIQSLSKNDSLSYERLERLKSLFEDEVEQNMSHIIIQYSFEEDEGENDEGENDEGENDEGENDEEDEEDEDEEDEDENEENLEENLENQDENLENEEENLENEDDIVEFENCDCRFCEEFRKYHYYREENIERIILNALLEIDKKTN
jgi:hypothetical protein